MRVLVATDGSTHANTAVEWLRHLPFPPDREVMVITVLEPPAAGWRGRKDAESDFPEARIAQARRLADDTASRLLTGRTATGRVVEGDAQHEIIAAARDWDANVIVVGARGLGAVKGFLLGSVSLGVVRNAPCPVLVCRGTPREVRTVTVALDGSKPAREALRWLARLPTASTLRLRLVGIAESGDSRTGAVLERLGVAPAETLGRAELEENLSAAAESVRSRVLDVEVTVAAGIPADEIIQRHHGGDLLVVGARGAGAATRLLLGSVSELVLRRADCPVLVARPGVVHGAD